MSEAGLSITSLLSVSIVKNVVTTKTTTSIRNCRLFMESLVFFFCRGRGQKKEKKEIEKPKLTKAIKVV